MAAITYDCALTCSSDATLTVDGTAVPLDLSGLIKTGQFEANPGANLTLVATLTGPTKSAWSIDVSPKCPGGKQGKKLWTLNGIFSKGGVKRTNKTAVPDSPCTAVGVVGDNLLAERIEVPVQLPKKKAAKKTVKKAVKAAKDKSHT